jgi:hypothetical protein
LPPEPVGIFFSSDIYFFTNINSIVSLQPDNYHHHHHRTSTTAPTPAAASHCSQGGSVGADDVIRPRGERQETARRTTNERRTSNVDERTTNVERRTRTNERRTSNDERRTRTNERRTTNDDERGRTTNNGQRTTHHLPPAPRATARGVERGWNDNDDGTGAQETSTTSLGP